MQHRQPADVAPAIIGENVGRPGPVPPSQSGKDHASVLGKSRSGEGLRVGCDPLGRLLALLHGGETDYVDAGGCNVVNVIDPPPSNDGEALTYVGAALDRFCFIPGIVSAACDCDGPCVEPPPGDVCSDAESVQPVNQTLVGTLDMFAPDERGDCGGGVDTAPATLN